MPLLLNCLCARGPLASWLHLQAPLMVAFFTTVGFGASVSLLRVGGHVSPHRI